VRGRVRVRIRKAVRRPGEAYPTRFIVDVHFRTTTPISQRTVAVADAFGLGIDEEKEFTIYNSLELQIKPTDIVYITGDSGSGKSLLLRELYKQLRPWAAFIGPGWRPDIRLDKPIIETVGETVEEALELLSRVGLGDAWLFLRSYSQLSDGQKYRYAIAKLIESGKQYWLLDEFCSTLDRDTAKVVAYNIQKLARKLGKCLIAATCHTDLFEDLNPSVYVRKGFGAEVKVQYFPNRPAGECSLMREIRIEEGTTEDYRKLAVFHYRSHHPGAVRRVFVARRGCEPAGVIVYGYPSLTHTGRKHAFKERIPVAELNACMSTIRRVVVHPKYRSIGLGTRLVRETLPRVGTPYVELIAVMAKYNPFAEKAGMKLVCIKKPDRRLLKVVRELEALGFDPKLISSTRYNLAVINSLSSEKLEELKQILTKVRNPNIRKTFIQKPYVKNKEWKEKVEQATELELAKIVQDIAISTQEKAYLLYRNPTAIYCSIDDKLKTVP